MNKQPVERAVTEKCNKCGRVRDAITTKVTFVGIMSRNSNGETEAAETETDWEKGDEREVQEILKDKVCTKVSK